MWHLVRIGFMASEEMSFEKDFKGKMAANNFLMEFPLKALLSLINRASPKKKKKKKKTRVKLHFRCLLKFRLHVLQTKIFKIETTQSPSYSNLPKVYEYLKFRFWPLTFCVKFLWLLFGQNKLNEHLSCTQLMVLNRNKTIFQFRSPILRKA